MPTTRAERLRKSSGTLATVLASAALARVITHFVLRPDVALHFQALRRVTGRSSQSLQRELARLEELGLIDREQDGRLVRYRAARDDVRWSTFRDLVARLADPAEVLRVALAELPGVDAAFIYGSYARRIRAARPRGERDALYLRSTRQALRRGAPVRSGSAGRG